MTKTEAAVSFVVMILYVALLAWLGYHGAHLWQIGGGILALYLAVVLYVGRKYPERETKLHDDLRKNGP